MIAGHALSLSGWMHGTSIRRFNIVASVVVLDQIEVVTAVNGVILPFILTSRVMCRFSFSEPLTCSLLVRSLSDVPFQFQSH